MTATIMIFSRLIPFSLISLLLFTPRVFGQENESNYYIEIGNVESVDNIYPSPSPIEKNPERKISAYGYEGENYKILVGQAELDPRKFFHASISQVETDFGELSATNPVERFIKLGVSNPSAHGYSIVGSANHPLLNTDGVTIADTTCDNGGCNEKKSGAWTNTLTYGFGYHCDQNCGMTFETKDDYAQIPDESQNEAPFPIIWGAFNQKTESKITYKVNLQGNQPTANPYNNTITYIAVPTY